MLYVTFVESFHYKPRLKFGIKVYDYTLYTICGCNYEFNVTLNDGTILDSEGYFDYAKNGKLLKCTATKMSVFTDTQARIIELISSVDDCAMFTEDDCWFCFDSSREWCVFTELNNGNFFVQGNQLRHRKLNVMYKIHDVNKFNSVIAKCRLAGCNI